MKIAICATIALLATSEAFAQQQPAPTASEQALGNKLFQEMQVGLNCSANLITMKAELDKANARIKELEPEADDKATAAPKK